MAYSELIKDFGKIRDYMRQFYIYGFRGRGEMGDKSDRSYDNEKRRIESWMGDYMSFRQEPSGKKSFISMESKDLIHNPLYNAFKAKSFTDKDIMLHFYILDILEQEAFSAGEIADIIATDYISEFDDVLQPDESTIRKKLKEYEGLGLVKSSKEGRKVVYEKCLATVDLEEWKSCVNFFSELDPCGAIGSFVLDRMEDVDDAFWYRHHYLLYALDSQILYQLLEAISEGKNVELVLANITHEVCPLKILVSSQTGRRYLMAYNYFLRDISIYRIDNIKNVVPKNEEVKKDKYLELAQKKQKYIWGASIGNGRQIDHLEMTLSIEKGAEHILDRLFRERRQGRIELLGNGNYKFVIDVYDAWELIPWIRTFMGRIVKLETTNNEVQEAFYEDLTRMNDLYGE
ncbi:MAG: WYL domain-containing protein [Firmicutes bacterium]|nr:WYL domain-containing protein [Bacillota bacterium]